MDKVRLHEIENAFVVGHENDGAVLVVQMVTETVTALGTVSDTVQVPEKNTEPEMDAVMVTVTVVFLVEVTEMVMEMVPVTEKEMEIVKLGFIMIINRRIQHHRFNDNSGLCSGDGYGSRNDKGSGKGYGDGSGYGSTVAEGI